MIRWVVRFLLNQEGKIGTVDAYEKDQAYEIMVSEFNKNSEDNKEMIICSIRKSGGVGVYEL